MNLNSKCLAPALGILVAACLALTGCGGGGTTTTTTTTTPIGTGPGNLSVSIFSPTTATPTEIINFAGSGFLDITSVTIGGVPAKFIANNDLMMQVWVPLNIPANMTSMALTTAGGTETIAMKALLDVPTITAIAPAGTTQGGSVTITGTKLDEVVQFSVNDTPLAASSVTATSAVLTTPKATPLIGYLSLEMTNGGVLVSTVPLYSMN